MVTKKNDGCARLYRILHSSEASPCMWEALHLPPDVRQMKSIRAPVFGHKLTLMRPRRLRRSFTRRHSTDSLLKRQARPLLHGHQILGWMKPRALHLRLRVLFLSIKSKTACRAVGSAEAGGRQIHLLIYLPIEEDQDNNRWFLWQPDHAGFDSRSVFNGRCRGIENNVYRS